MLVWRISGTAQYNNILDKFKVAEPFGHTLRVWLHFLFLINVYEYPWRAEIQKEGVGHFLVVI